MKIPLSRYIPLVMGLFVVGMFTLFIVRDFSAMEKRKPHNLREYSASSSGGTNSNNAANNANALSEVSSSEFGTHSEFTRPSPVRGIRWPKLLETTPQYSSAPPRLYANVDEALAAAATATTVVEKYPAYVSLLNVIEKWNPDDPDIPPNFVETLQHFNYSNPAEKAIAMRYRDAEIPFKLYAVPEVNAVVEKWSDEYLEAKLRNHNHYVEVSDHNHFMFWKQKGDVSKLYPDWKPPTTHIDMTFPTWLKIAKQADKSKLKNDTTHHYFITNSPTGDRKTFVAKDLNFFATDDENFFITNVPANKGIQCRFGMRGIIAETHYDGGKNMVAMLKGTKRYLLNPPTACKYLDIIPDSKHPSFRHSVIDWSNVDQAREHSFDKAAAIDTIVRTGEVLYIPSYWFHYPISLDYSIQCNSRSGSPRRGEGKQEIEECTGRTMDEQKLRRYNGEIPSRGNKRGKRNPSMH